MCCDTCRNAFHEACLKKRWGKAALPPADEDEVWRCPACCGSSMIRRKRAKTVGA